ncbi:SpoIID/LytB domain-containing protein [Aeromicrobium sp. Root344]|uniref:SpoIID/LytB domain-containing protein n=1 Tax=Aeromicrobium sp. Root344 TaxID=1736521 RepID=UPI0009E9DA0A|nr:SpoIID/LytB domain-containing protein [Aeromicrobium sp. Root344]
MLSWRTARRTSGLSLAAVLMLGVLAPSTAHAAGTEVTGGAPGKPAAAPKPPKVKVAKTKVPAVKGGTGKVVAELAKTSTSKFRMIGVTWSQQGLAHGIKVEVRTRTNGTWSSWTPLDYDGDDGEGGNPGTDPLWVGRADGVAARVSSSVGTPQDVRITTIDPGTDGQLSTASTASDTSYDGVAHASTAVDLGDGTPSYTPKPTIITRSQWGASSGTSCDSPLTGDRTRGVVVHHTAGSNTYAKADSAAIVRATQAYHVKGRGWCDIGYNFLVDKYGQIFEGRRGGVDRAVRAAHSGNLEVNTYTMGVSMMGNYDVTRPSAALKAAMVKLVGWRLGTNYIKAKGTYAIGGLTLNRIAGHRNVVSTECPGRYGYAWLSQEGGLRDRVEAYMSKYSTPIKTLYTSLGSSKTGAIYIGEARSSSGGRLDAKLMDLYARTGATAHYVSGRIRTEYDRLDSRSGTLGYPKDDPRTVDGVIRQHFDRGSVYAVSGKPKAFNVLGDIAKVYTRLGESTGTLGAPISSTYTVKAGVTRVDFAHGRIISTASTDKTVAYSSTGKVIGTSATARPATITSLTLKVGLGSVRVSWPAVSGATSYDVCLLADKTQTTCSRLVTKLTTTSVQLTGLKPTAGTDWYVKVRAVDGDLRGLWSALRGFNLLFAGDSVTVPSTRQITVTGHGYGHGIGMSQYGAQGAAKQGVTYDKILSRYYPGTTLGTKSGQIRVLISQDTDDPVTVAGRSGLVFREVSAGKTLKLPTTIGGETVARWRILQVTSDKTRSTLQYKTTGDYRSYLGTRWTGNGQFENPSTMSLILPDGSAVKYRGALRSAIPSAGSTARNTVNILPIEYYVRGVIADEMPSSWMPEALKAQAVAARTYGVHAMTSSRYYDICSTTACQVYGGASRETTATTAAARATVGKIVTFDGKPAFTQFSSSSGGYTAVGSQPYLKAVSDPWDDWSGNANHAWTTTVAASTIEKAYPSVGTLKQVKVSTRNGFGDWGGRVTTISLVGSTKTVTISGDDARWAFGLKSSWFRF